VIVDERVIVAGTGEIGLGQRFCNIVQTAHPNKLFQKDPIEVARQLTILAVNDFASTKVTMGSYGALADVSFDRCGFGYLDITNWHWNELLVAPSLYQCNNERYG
jgi:hypothetical protein